MKVNLIFYNGVRLDCDISSIDVEDLKERVLINKNKRLKTGFMFQNNPYNSGQTMMIYDNLFVDIRTISTILEKVKGLDE